MNNSRAFEISVVLCTHNPRMDYLSRVVAALRAQTLLPERWELLVIDNRSAIALSGQLDMGWHPYGRCIREDELGLTPARLRGIRESRGGLIVFVDDDNVLDSVFLEKTLEIAREHPELGAWGGRVTPECELPPPDSMKAYLSWIGVREFDCDQWACCWPLPDNVLPWGAGMVVRRVVAETYARGLAVNQQRRNLDRRGDNLVSGGDIDLAMTSWECGLGTGVFTRLHLVHLIPSARLQPGYLEKFMENIAYSDVMLRHQKGLELPSGSMWSRIYHALRGLRRRGVERMVYHARQRGVQRALRELR